MRNVVSDLDKRISKYRELAESQLRKPTALRSSKLQQFYNRINTMKRWKKEIQEAA